MNCIFTWLTQVLLYVVVFQSSTKLPPPTNPVTIKQVQLSWWHFKASEENETNESYFGVKLEEREFLQDLQSSGVLEFWNFENRKWKIENIFYIVCELKELQNHLSTNLKKLWVGGGWMTTVNCRTYIIEQMEMQWSIRYALRWYDCVLT